MTTEELFTAEKISLSMLDKVSDTSPYWESAYSFILENWTRDISRLTQKQANWLSKIHEDMIEMRIEGKL